MAKINPGEFMRQVQAEARKVVWPTWRETSTTVEMRDGESFAIAGLLQILPDPFPDQSIVGSFYIQVLPLIL